MSKDNRPTDTDFSYGLRELRAARLAQHDAQAGATGVRKAPPEAPGSDPYNTSGSFDRKKHWSRVGKR